MNEEEQDCDVTNLEEACILHEAQTDVAKGCTDNVQEGSLHKILLTNFLSTVFCSS